MTNSKDTTFKTYEFKLRLNKSFVEACERELEHSRQIYNAAVAWGRFFRMTKSKAENAGRTFERVNPRYSSQICSRCGHRQKVPLAIRVYECAKCGFVIGRDHNSAIIIDRAPASPNKRLWRRDSASEKRERKGRTQSEPQRGVD